jgi:hypothetical protein
MLCEHFYRLGPFFLLSNSCYQVRQRNSPGIEAVLHLRHTYDEVRGLRKELQ